MADYEFPPELIDAQRAYWEADARVQEVTDALPPSQEMTDGQRAQLAEVRAERLRLIGVLYEHEWFENVDDPYAARLGLQQAAKA